MPSRCTTMLVIRNETEADWPTVGQIHTRAFAQDAEAALVEKLRASADFDGQLSLVAELDGQVVGHVLFSPVDLVMANDPLPALALAPLAVLPGYQRRGIGRELVGRGLDVCRVLGHQVVLVVGDPAYYQRFGFMPAGPLGLDNNLGITGDAFMVLELVPEALQDVSGLVVYPSVFQEV